jgi:AcrR family transcriptional regulator
MARWKPNARERLEKAAMELYGERGFDETAVADIAERAGLTERTFFRYFTDKREVLFGRARMLEDFLVERVVGGPGSMQPMEVVAVALEATAPIFEERRDFARKRHALIATHAELKERELIKLASLASAIGDALRRRGVPDPAASLAAETGIAIFKIAFERWVNDTKRQNLARHIRRSVDELKAVTGGIQRGAPTSRLAKGQRRRSL